MARDRDTASTTIKVHGRDDYEITISEGWDRQQGVAVHNLVMPDQVAATALAMMERWGTVAAAPDGEDSAGRTKLRLQTPQELTDFAFEAAEAFWVKAGATGHLLFVPGNAERTRLLDEARKTDEGN